MFSFVHKLNIGYIIDLYCHNSLKCALTISIMHSKINKGYIFNVSCSFLLFQESRIIIDLGE